MSRKLDFGHNQKYFFSEFSHSDIQVFPDCHTIVISNIHTVLLLLTVLNKWNEYKVYKNYLLLPPVFKNYYIPVESFP